MNHESKMLTQPYYPPQFKDQVEGLERLLAELFDLKPPFVVSVFAYEDSPPFGGFRIAKINIRSDKDGTCFSRSGAITDWATSDDLFDSLPKDVIQRSEADNFVQALILASEDYVRCFHIEPFRPEGWESDIDEFKDAKAKLREIVEAGETAS